MIGLRFEVMLGEVCEVARACAPSAAVCRRGIWAEGAGGLLGREGGMAEGLEGREEGFAAPNDGAMSDERHEVSVHSGGHWR